MRVVKFRAWDIEAEEMIHFDLFSCVGLRPEELDAAMQYTGLKDRNGMGIYEGDVVRLSFGIPPTSIMASIEYRNDEYLGEVGCAVSGWWLCGLNGAKSAPLHSCYEFDIEVIGNIHENPELLEAN